MYRVLKPNGIAYIMIPPWFGIHGGHDFKPFHYFPFPIAKFLREKLFEEKIKENSYEEANLHKTTFRRSLELINNSKFELLTTKDTHFRIHILTRIPLLREFMVPSAVFILKKQLR
jgi:SAM-dependent methyltransferase